MAKRSTARDRANEELAVQLTQAFAWSKYNVPTILDAYDFILKHLNQKGDLPARRGRSRCPPTSW